MALKKYTFLKDYKSDAGIWNAGETVDLTEEVAAWFNRDVDGCLALTADKVVEERTLEEPPEDRQLKAAQKRGRGPGEGAMSHADFKATVDKGR